MDWIQNGTNVIRKEMKYKPQKPDYQYTNNQGIEFVNSI